ncbi:MAG TPA: CoA transferase [Dehalococcoidia bacterium]|nr:CoA transferase [Dehalococcoidia bacterium]
MNRPLEGIKVIDLTTTAAMPAACLLLADWGAEVIKIEHPQGGDPGRWISALGWLPKCPVPSPLWEQDNENKRSIALDLRLEEGRQIGYKLIAGADVFASNLQEPSLKRIGMDYPSLRQVNPRLVYAHLTGFGSKGPNADKPGYDYSAFWASSGIMSTMGEPDGPPAFQRPAMGDHTTALAIAGGITAALLARERTGQGQKVDVALMATGMWVTSLQHQATLLSGQDIKRVGRRDMINPMWNCYRAKDGRWVQFVMLFPERFWPPFCKALGIEHLEHDPRFDTTEKREQNCAELVDIIDKVIAAKTLEEWTPLFDKYELVWAYVHTIKSALEDPQVEANNFLVDVEHPVVGKMKSVNSPIIFNETPITSRTPAPDLGQHSEEILLELGYSWEDISRFKERGVIL